MSELEKVALAAVIAGASRRGAEPGAGDISSCSAWEKGDELPGVLSGGQRQRFAIARALPTSRRCCWPTSRPARSTPRAASRCSSSSAGCTPAGRRSCSSPTTRSLPRRPSRVVGMQDGRVVAARCRRAAPTATVDPVVRAVRFELRGGARGVAGGAWLALAVVAGSLGGIVAAAIALQPSAPTRCVARYRAFSLATDVIVGNGGRLPRPGESDSTQASTSSAYRGVSRRSLLPSEACSSRAFAAPAVAGTSRRT